MTAGSFEVSSRGNSGYEIDVPLPPGTMGVGPALSLVYSNAAQSGMLGVGWGLKGLPVIERAGANIAQDGFRGGVEYNVNDRFAYSGQRLITIQGAEGRQQLALSHRNRILAAIHLAFDPRTTARTAAAGRAGGRWSPRPASVYEFGRTDDSRILASGGRRLGQGVGARQDPRSERQHLCRHLYRHALWRRRRTSVSISRCASTTPRNGNAGLAAGRRIDFSYEAAPNPVKLYIGGYPVMTASRMTRIASSVGGGVPASRMDMGYETSPSTGRRPHRLV